MIHDSWMGLKTRGMLLCLVVLYCWEQSILCIAAQGNSSSSCDASGKCGPFGVCSSQDFPGVCSCLEGFYPQNEEEWSRGNWSGGCRRRIANCSDDVFLTLQMMELSGYTDSWSWTAQRNECQGRCLSNCSCLAYASGLPIGCTFWIGTTLMNIRKSQTGLGSDIYIRVSNSEQGIKNDYSRLIHKKDFKKKMLIILILVAFVITSTCTYFLWKWIANHRAKIRLKNQLQKAASTQVIGEELPMFKFEELAIATSNFSEANKLGKGGFGYVYKGGLAGGREIAVKRLSSASGQGMQEFMNEVVLISKLQHRNLVRLLGCCAEDKERMLVYEYMPYKSLDFFLFDTSQEILDWRKRFKIIQGICRGLIYLHRDSRLKIIHRDLKPSNILLDTDWNPKISDFGMARIFGTKQDHVRTIRVAGTQDCLWEEKH